MLGRSSVFAAVILISISANKAVAESACDSLCSPHRSQFEFKDLIQKARVYGEVDRRGELSKVAKEFGIKPSEAANLRKAVGSIACWPSKGLEATTLTAFVSGKSDEIISAAHGMVDAFGAPRDLSKCFFENFENPPRRIYLREGSARNILPDHEIISHGLGPPDDRVRLKLKSSVPNVEPLNPGDLDKPPGKGTPLLLVGAQADDFKGSGKDPIVSACELRDVVSLGDGASRMKTDCSSDRGNSGSPYLYRDAQGKLRVAGIDVKFLNTGPPNHAPYSPDSNASIGLMIDQDFASWFKDK